MRALLTALFLSLAAALPAQADPDEMRAVIDRQLRAFAVDDFAGAMEFASPTLKRYFGTPGNFAQMVTRGYPMVWRYDGFEFLENRVEDGAHWQRLRITDEAGVTHLLDYRMIETPDGWRINGVIILDAADLTA
jgi:hypothetical protein